MFLLNSAGLQGQFGDDSSPPGQKVDNAFGQELGENWVRDNGLEVVDKLRLLQQSAEVALGLHSLDVTDSQTNHQVHHHDRSHDDEDQENDPTCERQMKFRVGCICLGRRIFLGKHILRQGNLQLT
jgi:hypothetical protein